MSTDYNGHGFALLCGLLEQAHALAVEGQHPTSANVTQAACADQLARTLQEAQQLTAAVQTIIRHSAEAEPSDPDRPT